MAGLYLKVYLFLTTTWTIGIAIGNATESYLDDVKFNEAMSEYEENMQEHFIGLSQSEEKINDAKRKDIYHVTSDYFSEDKRQKCLSNLEHMIVDNFLNGLPTKERNWNIFNTDNTIADLTEMVNWFFPLNSFSFFASNESENNWNNEKFNEEIMTKM